MFLNLNNFAIIGKTLSTTKSQHAEAAASRILAQVTDYYRSLPNGHLHSLYQFYHVEILSLSKVLPFVVSLFFAMFKSCFRELSLPACFTDY